MLGRTLLLALALARGRALASDFEADDFDVPRALLALGVDVAAIPPLAPLVRESATPDCHAACDALETIYGGDATYQAAAAADGGNETASYADFVGSYWSANQADVRPRCVFQPPDRAAVRVLVLLSRLARCPFALRSGGHAAFAGASSIEGGITVSLRRLDGIALSGDKKTVTVQPGLQSNEVYHALAEHDLAIVSGRIADMGIGGFTLGGGIGFLSRLYGFACDNVRSFEVVTASGSIVKASFDENPDLYWALRGGGGNFGIVTGFEFETVPLPGNSLWGSTLLHLAYSPAGIIDAFATAVAEEPRDPGAGLWVCFVKYWGVKLAATQLWHARPDAHGSAVFRKFRDAPWPLPFAAAAANTRLTSLVERVAGDSPPGYRECYYPVTVRGGDTEVLARSLAHFWEGVEALRGRVAGVLPCMIWQGVTEGELRAMARNGGNPLGLSADRGPYYIIHLAARYDRAEDDELVRRTFSSVLRAVAASARDLGVAEDWVYMNYASEFQDVIASYGAANKARLKAVAARYDPAGVFQTLSPGYFKLDRAPNPDPEYFSYPGYDAQVNAHVGQEESKDDASTRDEL